MIMNQEVCLEWIFLSGFDKAYLVYF